MNTTKTIAALGAAAACAAAGPAWAQSAPARPGFEHRLGARPQQPQSGARTEVRTSTNFIQTDGSGTYSLTIEGDNIRASINGKEVPPERIVREGDTVRLLNEDGSVAAEFNLSMKSWGDFDRAMAWSDLFAQGGAPAQPAEPPPVMLGITMGEVPEALMEHLGLEPGSAVLIGKVYEGLPAAEAGLKDADILIAVDGTQPLTEAKVRELLRAKKPGDTVRLTIIRKGEKREVQATLAPYDAGKFGGSVEYQEQLLDPQEREGFWGYGFGDTAAARQALQEALRQLKENRTSDAGAIREQVQRAIEEALRNLNEAGARLQVLPRVYGAPRARGQILLGDQPGQVFSVPLTPPAPAAPAAPSPRDENLSRQLDELKAQLDEVRRSRDELKAQLDDIRSMLKEMARQRQER